MAALQTFLKDCALVLGTARESHLYPSVAFFRSQHQRQSWVLGAGHDPQSCRHSLEVGIEGVPARAGALSRSRSRDTRPSIWRRCPRGGRQPPRISCPTLSWASRDAARGAGLRPARSTGGRRPFVETASFVRAVHQRAWRAA